MQNNSISDDFNCNNKQDELEKPPRLAGQVAIVSVIVANNEQKPLLLSPSGEVAKRDRELR